MTRLRRPVRPPPGLGWLDIHPTHYETLGLAEDATAGQIAARLAALRSPGSPPGTDPAPSPEPAGTAALHLACAVLADPLRRPVYDAWLARERTGLAAASGRGPGRHWAGGRPRWLTGAVVAAMLLVLLAGLGAAAWWWLAGAWAGAPPTPPPAG